jgi:hypothetical protein
MICLIPSSQAALRDLRILSSLRSYCPLLTGRQKGSLSELVLTALS